MAHPQLKKAAIEHVLQQNKSMLSFLGIIFCYFQRYVHIMSSMVKLAATFFFVSSSSPFCALKLCCMKVEVDMEKISADIAAAEEAARKRLAEREKDAGERGVRDTPTCVLAEEEKHICATHGNKSHQNSLSQGSTKEGEDVQSNTTDTDTGEWCWASLCGLLLGLLTQAFFFFFVSWLRKVQIIRGAWYSRSQWGNSARGQGDCPRRSHGGSNQWQQHRLGNHLCPDRRRPSKRATRGARESTSSTLSATCLWCERLP